MSPQCCATGSAGSSCPVLHTLNEGWEGPSAKPCCQSPVLTTGSFTGRVQCPLPSWEKSPPQRQCASAEPNGALYSERSGKSLELHETIAMAEKWLTKPLVSILLLRYYGYFLFVQGV